MTPSARTTIHAIIEAALAAQVERKGMRMDDLVKRLRAGTGGGKPWMDLHKEAADRIDELEAKLAKAVEALEWVKFGGGPTGESYHLNAVDTLAELTGGKDD